MGVSGPKGSTERYDMVTTHFLRLVEGCVLSCDTRVIPTEAPLTSQGLADCGPGAGPAQAKSGPRPNINHHVEGNVGRIHSWSYMSFECLTVPDIVLFCLATAGVQLRGRGWQPTLSLSRHRQLPADTPKSPSQGKARTLPSWGGNHVSMKMNGSKQRQARGTHL